MSNSIDPSPSNVFTSAEPNLSGKDVARLKLVCRGLTLITLAMLLEVLLAIALTPLMFGLQESKWKWILGVLLYLMISGPLLMMVGVGLCLAVPSRARAARFAFATIVLAVAGVVALRFKHDLPHREGATPWTDACLLASIASFLWYLRRLAVFIGRRTYARRAVYLLIAIAAAYGSTWIGRFPGKFDGPSPGDYLSAVRTILTFVSVLWYASLLSNVRQATRRSMACAQ